MLRIWGSILFILLLSLFTKVIIQKGKSRRSSQFLNILSMLVFMAVFWITLFSRQPSNVVIFNLRPHFFRQLLRIKYNSDGSITNIQLGPLYEGTKLNILLFVPIGLLLPIVIRHINSFWKTLLIGSGLSISIEVLQYILHLGWFDVDDIIMNMCGICVGYLEFKLLFGKSRCTKK